MKVRKILIAAGILTAIAGGAWFFTHDARQPETAVAVRVTESTAPNNYELAQKLTGRDILREEGVTLERIPIQGASGGTVTMQALLADNIDVAGGSVSVWVNAISKGARVKLVYPGSASEKPEHSGLLVLEGSPIHTIKDLAGRKIAVNVLGAEAEFIISTFLRQNGLSLSQVELIVVPADSQEQVLRSGQADAIAWTTSGGAQFDRALDKGGVRRLPGTSSFETRGGVTQLTTCEGFRESFVKEHPETVMRYLRAVDAARRIVWEEYGKNPERVRSLYAELLGAKGGNPSQAKYYRGPRWSPENQFIADSDIQFWIDRFVENGTLKPDQIKPADVYTNEFNPLYGKNGKKLAQGEPQAGK